MKNRQDIINMVIGIMGLVAALCGLFARMNFFWRLVHIAGGAVMAYSQLPVLIGLYKQLTTKK